MRLPVVAALAEAPTLTRVLAAIAVLVLLGAGCGSTQTPGGSDAVSGPSTSTVFGPSGEMLGSPANDVITTPPVESSFATVPPVEGTNVTELPQPPDDRITVNLPSLPIGGQADDDTAVPQCVRVSWLGDPVPSRVSVSVTDVRIDPDDPHDPEDTFEVRGSGCPSPSCLDSDFSFTYDPEQRLYCYVPIEATGTPYDSATLLLTGDAHCPAELAGDCRLLRGSSQITVTVPEQQSPPNTTPSSTG